MSAPSSAEIAVPTPSIVDEARLAIAGFLARYSGTTLVSYRSDLRAWFQWLEQRELAAFDFRWPHVELWMRHMEQLGLAPATIGRRLSTVAGFYRFAVIDGCLDRSPAEYVRRPRVDGESTTLGLDRMELGAFIAQAAAAGPMDHALACPLGLLGLRVSEACCLNVEDLGMERGHRTFTVVGKGGKTALVPMPPRVARAVDMAIGERACGPILRARSGQRMNRHAATRVVRRLAKRAGITKRISPHSLRHSLHHRRPGCRRPSSGCPDRRPPRRPQDHDPLRPRPPQFGSPRQPHRHRLHRRGGLTGTYVTHLDPAFVAS